LDVDVLEAIPRLARSGAIPAENAGLCTRIARRELVSVWLELRLVLYVGVLLVTAGVGLLVKEHLDDLGPFVISAAIAIAAGACLAWTFKKSAPFSRSAVPSPNLAFDFILLLGALLTAADLAYVEVHFTPLGESWPWHLLFVSLVCLGLAIRFDSRIVFSLALSTFSAWRGVSTTILEKSIWGASSETVRMNALGCGILFVVLATALRRSGWKSHFEPAAIHVGWILILGGMVSGVAGSDLDTTWSVASLLVGGALAGFSFRGRRFSLFAFGVVAAYIGLSAIVLRDLHAEALGCFWFSASSVAALVGLFLAHRRMKEPL